MHQLSPFSAPGRRVRHLRLRAREAEQARRFANSIGDALHTASLPEHGGERLLAIRRLALGHVTVGASPAALAIVIERVIRDAAARAVAFDAPGARTADMVWLPSRGAALTALARKLARHEDVTAWYWAQVVPGWLDEASPIVRWRSLLEAAHSGEGAAVLAATVIVAALRAAPAAVQDVLAATTRQDAAFRLLTAGFVLDEPDGKSVTPARRLSPAAVDVLTRAAAALGGTVDLRRATNAANTDVRLLWLGALLAIHEHPARAAQPELPTQVAAWFRQALPTGSAAARVPKIVADAHSELTVETTSPPRASESAAPDRTETPVNPVVTAHDGLSSFAGLFFLVPVLRRLGLATHLVARADLLEAAFPARLLMHLGRRAGPADEDPLTQALAARVGDTSRDPVPAWLYHAWYVALRRWCRRHARIEWRDLVRRSGRVRTDDTHIEIFFEPRQVDIRLRRLALDVDPGWVPWLGRVIRFHYVSPDECVR